MHQLSVAIVSPFEAAPQGAQLVIFADQKHFVPEEESVKLIAAAGKYAAKNHVFLVTQRFIVEDFLCACMFGPDGVLIGVGQATHLNLSLRQHNLQRSDEVSVFDTPFGKTALLVDVDINMPQVCRAAVRMGAELIISTQHMPLYDFYEDRVNYGAVNAARSNGVQVISVIGTGAAVVDANGHFITSYTDALPVFGVIEPGVSLGDRRAMKVAHELLIAHRDLIDEPQEAKSDE